MAVQVNELVIGNYSTLLKKTQFSIQGISKTDVIQSLPDVKELYPCNHKPCCSQCFFSSKIQQMFEDTVMSMIGPMKVELNTIEMAISDNTNFKNISDRIKHLILSPKYDLIFDPVNKTIQLNKGNIFYQALKFESWNNAFMIYQDPKSHRRSSMDNFSMISHRRVKSDDSKACGTSCNFRSPRIDRVQLSGYRGSINFDVPNSLNLNTLMESAQDYGPNVSQSTVRPILKKSVNFVNQGNTWSESQHIQRQNTGYYPNERNEGVITTQSFDTLPDHIPNNPLISPLQSNSSNQSFTTREPILPQSTGRSVRLAEVPVDYQTFIKMRQNN